MKRNQTEYYFSTTALFFITIFLVSFSSVFIYLFLIFYKDSLFVAFGFSLPLLVVLIGLPDYIRFMYCAITKRPALILSRETLTNNANGKVYSWSQIKSISYNQHTGIKAPPGGYISVDLKDSQDTFRIPQNSIKCKTKNLLRDLQKYHRAHFRHEYERIANGGSMNKNY
jgi:hypothetical protein